MYKKLICPDNIIQIINNELWKMTKTKIARHLLILVIVSVSESKHNFNAKKKYFPANGETNVGSCPFMTRGRQWTKSFCLTKNKGDQFLQTVKVRV